MKYRTPITIEKMNIQTEEWEVYFDLLHANINKNAKDNEFLSSGAVQSKRELAFDVRYCPPLKEIARNTQIYRIVTMGRRTISPTTTITTSAIKTSDCWGCRTNGKH